MGKTLSKPPLVETIFEIKWELREAASGLARDPHYNLLIGQLYDRLKAEYPFHQQLPAASMPAEILEGVVQHRFRKGENLWPVFQLGPGVLTVNDTQKYTWEDYKTRVENVVDTLFNVYPGALEVTSATLRYINAVAFNFEEDDIFRFLEKNLKLNVSLYPSLFQDSSVRQQPEKLDMKFSFRSEKPQGIVNLRVARGKKQKTEALFWELSVVSTRDQMPALPSDLSTWLKYSHKILESWFFELISEELLESFR
jgi:uncharacterized protein (TIGR04255 family)